MSIYKAFLQLYSETFSNSNIDLWARMNLQSLIYCFSSSLQTAFYSILHILYNIINENHAD